MSAKTKRQPKPTQHHLKHSRQLLEDYLFQYLPLLMGMNAISRINLFTWISGQWGLSPDAKAGVPYMLLETLRLQRQHQLKSKGILKPFSLTLFGSPEENSIPKALPLLQEINEQSHTATIKTLLASWQEILKQLQVQLLHQPQSERNLLLMDPLGLSLPKLQELLARLPKKLDVLLLIPTASVLKAWDFAQKAAPHAAAQQLAALLPDFSRQTEQQQEEATAEALTKLQQELKQALVEGSKHYGMHLTISGKDTPLLLFGFTTDALMMEKMLFAKEKLEKRQEQQMQTGAQIGLFGTIAPAAKEQDNLTSSITGLLGKQSEWSNQELYLALLQAEILPQKAVTVLQEMFIKGQVEILDERKKKVKEVGTLPINHTAYKLPATSRYFRLKSNQES